MKIYKNPFAATGDRLEIPLTEQPNGTISEPTGWGPDYQRADDDPQVKHVGRSEMNGVLYDITEALGFIQLNGFAPWSSAAGPYTLNSVVWHGGKLWQSRSNNNSQTPSSSSSGWIEFNISNLAPKTHTHTIAQVTGLQTALDGKQAKLNFTPVNKAGDTMTGNLRAPNVNAVDAFNVGNNAAWGVYASMEPQGLWVGNGHQRWRWYMDTNGGHYSLGMYTGAGAWVNWAIQVNPNRRVSFAERPTGQGRDLAYVGEFGGVGDIGTYAFLGTQAGSVGPGATVSGNQLTWANASRSAQWGYVGYGTWRCLGYAEAIGGANDDARASLFQRIA